MSTGSEKQELSTAPIEDGKIQVGDKISKEYVIHALKSAVYLVVMVWLAAIWIYSSAYGQSSRSGNIKIIVSDLDGGAIGQSLIEGCLNISGIDGMAAFHVRNMSFEEGYNEVWKGRYWGAIFAMPEATTEFDRAVTDGNTSYSPESAITYIFNEARWPTTAEGYVSPTLEEAVTVANTIFLQSHGKALLADNNATTLTTDGLGVLLDGIQATSDDIYTVNVGIKYFLDTAAMVFPALITFFYSMALRAAPGILGPIALKSNYIYRISASFCLTCIVGISWGLWYEAFPEGNGISGGQYCLIWLTFWMYSLIAFLVYDTMTGVLPNYIFPPFVLVYIIINVTAAAFPIDLKPRFFHLDYIWPGYNCFELFITILSHGSTSRVYRNVPVLFGWLIVWFPLNFLANKKKHREDLAMTGMHV